MLVEQHHVVAFIERRQYAFALGNLLLGLGEALGVFGISHTQDVEPYVVRQPLHILIDALF